MREILFRGKAVDDGRWVEGWYGKQSFGSWPLHESIAPAEEAEVGCLHYEKIIPSTLGQYTGLSDSYGVKIFEGDIVEGSYFNEEDGYGIIQWNDGAFEIANNHTCATFHDNCYASEFVVIGNIHDNPALLDGGSDA